MENGLEMSDEFFGAWLWVEPDVVDYLDWDTWIGGGSPWECAYMRGEVVK